MASTTDPAALTPEQLRIVDQARQRLDQLTKAIEAARHAVVMGRPMPDLKAIQSHSAILVQTTSSITSHITTHADLLSTLVAYPSTNFPGRTQEGLAGHLLRKKLEPNVESWVDEGRGVGMEAVDIEKAREEQVEEGGRTGLEADWYMAAAWTAGEARRVMEESEGRGEEMDDSEEEEEDGDGDGDVEMGGREEGRGEGGRGGGAAAAAAVGGKPEPGRPEMTVAQMARFMNTGIMP